MKKKKTAQPKKPTKRELQAERIIIIGQVEWACVTHFAVQQTCRIPTAAQSLNQQHAVEPCDDLKAALPSVRRQRHKLHM